MAGVDLSRYAFDRDLTFCALLMHRDGTIYHTYGGRNWKDAQSHLSMESLVGVMRRTLTEHEAYDANPAAAVSGARWTVEHLPPLARRIAGGQTPDCIHCHSVQDWEVASAIERDTWSRDDLGIHPDPLRIGLEFDRDDQSLITSVIARSAAANAGLIVGDRVEKIGGRWIATFGDIQRALDDVRFGWVLMTIRTDPPRVAPPGVFEPVPAASPGTPQTGRSRSGRRKREPTIPETFRIRLRLPSDWRDPDPVLFSWRSMKWNLVPAPGFGGPQLDANDLAALDLSGDTFAFRVQYLVTWGPRAETGRNAAKAGIRVGDVVVAIDGKRDFESVEHFHSWFRLERRVGQTVPVELIRGTQRRVVMLPLIGRD